MNTSTTAIERIVNAAIALRLDLIDSSGRVHPKNLADDGTTTVQGALLDLRAVIDAFLEQSDPDDQITGEQSTE